MAHAATNVKTRRNFSVADLKRAVRRGAARALNDVGENSVLEPARRDAPLGGPETPSGRRRRVRGELHPGHLRESGRVDHRATIEILTFVCAFHAVYAAKQHEELDWHHPHGGRAKYLEIHAKKIVPILLRANVALAVNEELQKLPGRR